MQSRKLYGNLLETMKIFGLTGGICSGKSRTSKLFSALRVGIIDADQLARDVVTPGSKGLESVISRFGAEYLLEDGTLNRPKLGDRVFKNQKDLSDLNEILHPLIEEAYQHHAEIMEQGDYSYCLYDCPLLFELGLHTRYKASVLVAASRELQTERLLKRGHTIDQAEARLGAQMDLESRTALATHIILNDNDSQALEIRVINTHRQLLDLCS